MKKILVCGLPGSGKTTFAKELQKQLKKKGKAVAWFNADVVREMNNDWDFSPEGRIRQCNRMKSLSDGMMTDYVICDFVAPLKQIRNIFDADYTIWMDTINQSQYEDTNQIFEKPENANLIIKVKDASNIIPFVIREI